jgi:hypothetical protein
MSVPSAWPQVLNFFGTPLVIEPLADVPRAAFDARLQALRRAGSFALAGAEGRHGLTADERAADIEEDGTLLLCKQPVNASCRAEQNRVVDPESGKRQKRYGQPTARYITQRC